MGFPCSCIWKISDVLNLKRTIEMFQLNQEEVLAIGGGGEGG